MFQYIFVEQILFYNFFADRFSEIPKTSSKLDEIIFLKIRTAHITTTSRTCIVSTFFVVV